ncbi:MAG: ubiquitin-like small modifier protein 1 [Candidatus Hodarchaeota archaeon]
MTENLNSDKVESITVKVKFFATFKYITNQNEIEIQLDDGTNIAQLMEILFKSYKDLEKEIYNDNRIIKDYVQILKNGRNIKYLDNINTKLENNDVIAMFPPVAGGK